MTKTVKEKELVDLYTKSTKESFVSAESFLNWVEQKTAAKDIVISFEKEFTLDDWLAEKKAKLRQNIREELVEKLKHQPGKKLSKKERKEFCKSETFLSELDEKTEQEFAEREEQFKIAWEKNKDAIIRKRQKKRVASLAEKEKDGFDAWNEFVLEEALQQLDYDYPDFEVNHMETMVKEVQEIIDNWLKHGDISLIYLDYHNISRKERLTFENLPDFFGIIEDMQYNDALVEKIFEEHDALCMEEYVQSYIRKHLCGWEKLANDVADEVHELISEEAIECSYEIWERLQLGKEHVFSCLQENPKYGYLTQRAIEKQKREEELRESVLTAIPKRYPDLYPLARKIKRKFFLHIGPTNSGKTFAAMSSLRKKGEGIYLAPLRLLAFEQYEQLNADGFRCSLITGEERNIIEGATIQSSTIEMMDPMRKYVIAVIDEAQMVSDKDRGWAWTAAILGIRSPEIHICAAPEAENILVRLISECGDVYEIIRHERQTPLTADRKPFKFPKDVEAHDALIVFSKRNVHAVAYELRKRGVSCSVIYGNLPYDVRQAEARKFASGETDVLVSTDAIGIGLNLPIKRVVFLETAKYDGVSNRLLKVSEVKQIDGRAGRKGIYEYGTYTGEGNMRFLKQNVGAEVTTIQKAVIGFPPVLVSLKSRLSEILVQWNKIPEADGYTRMDTSRMKTLVEDLERQTNDKKLIYNFATIPFNEKGEEVILWDAMVKEELYGRRMSLKKAEKMFPLRDKNMSLNEMEQAYKICDLLYQYNTRFEHPEDTEEILNIKKELSKRILKELSSNGLKPRLCKYCGRELPWNYPYGMCQECHDSRYERNNFYDYYFDY